MDMATSQYEVGIRDLKNNLSRHLAQVRAGREIVITERGRPVARITASGEGRDRLHDLVASGAVRPPRADERRRPVERIESGSPVSDLVAEQRR